MKYGAETGCYQQFDLINALYSNTNNFIVKHI